MIGSFSGILEQHEALVSGKMSSRELVDSCLARIANPAGEGARTFIRVWEEQARRVAQAQDDLLRSGYATSALAGVPVSIKDLFDVKGEVTLAGTKALDDCPPASADAPVVKRLKAAGAVLVGRTNMTQFAFSAVGINPHYGTPGNPWDRDRIPGGSSSGAAVSVADGMAIAAIGSDTVGSIRVPAALCGIVGFKPTQSAVSRVGAIPLSTTLDTVGPLARTVQDCALLHSTIAGESLAMPRVILSGLRLAVPTDLVLEGLDANVSKAFERACKQLSTAGAVLREVSTGVFFDIRSESLNATIQSVEAFAWHRDLLARRGSDYDPNVKKRVERGAQFSAADYARALRRRAELMTKFDAVTSPYEALILPTVPIIAPLMDECGRDEDNIRAQLIRNPSLFNLLDRPSISIPMHHPGEPPTGFTIVGERHEDFRLLAIAGAIEELFVSQSGDLEWS